MKLILPVLVVIFIGCSAPITTSNFDKSTDFALFKTFSILEGKAKLLTDQREYVNPEAKKAIKQALTNELIKAGYRAVSKNPDLLVVFDIVITEMVDPRVDSAVIYKPWVDTKIDSFNYTEGLLVVRLIDQAKGKMVWQGSLSGILNYKPKQFNKRAKTYIAKLLGGLNQQDQ